jgi:hypothetical protein
LSLEGTIPSDQFAASCKAPLAPPTHTHSVAAKTEKQHAPINAETTTDNFTLIGASFGKYMNLSHHYLR